MYTIICMLRTHRFTPVKIRKEALCIIIAFRRTVNNVCLHSFIYFKILMNVSLHRVIQTQHVPTVLEVMRVHVMKGMREMVSHV